MKKLLLSILIITALFAAGCAKTKPEFKLRIKESSWSESWEYTPEEVTNEYDVVLGREYTIKQDDDLEFVFLIKKVTDEYIVIETTKPFSDNEDGTIDLDSTKTEFKVYFNKETKLITPSLDAGDIYYLTLVN